MPMSNSTLRVATTHSLALVAMSKKPRHRRRTSKQERNIKQML